ncbi:PREDICTED: uncharacterized protein LOC101300812 [Fragaria vesca subsp. vesca]|uniref:uncharacterized protein LOC101300812 n=1 Tax=Fragaria vesca subsp. vesca TaxID=101020 RepID=UPI0002C2FA1C|nr:PREDICTED: uncharacterized protein LOC101300812 [Fragaria vesca subsp. vesca]
MDFQFKFTCTSTTTDDEQTAATTQKQRLKPRKVAIFFAYYSVEYQGMQKNPGAKTIQGDPEEAIYLSGAVPEQDRLSVEVWVLMSRFIDQSRNDVYSPKIISLIPLLLLPPQAWS